MNRIWRGPVDMRHVCGLQGFGLGIHDICPGCEFDRLQRIGVEEEIALQAADLRAGMNPDISSPPILAWLQEKFRDLEKRYGKRIP
ncbi:MAG: hypothetical protein Q8P12_04835 [bacterium]|nr:hypothetical protein [bacterium]